MKKVIYVKKIPKKIEKIFFEDEFNQYSQEKKRKIVHFFFKFFPSVLIIGGMSIIGVVIYPIMLYQFQYIPKTLRHEMIKPIKILQDYEIQATSEDNVQKEAASAVINKVDTTNAKTWFPDAQFVKKEASKISNYTLSIPTLGINNADVEVNSEDLKKSLVHYPESALPGELGNPVIFGHSTLPIFYNPKNYETIFSTLPEIQKGDKIIARVDGIEYTYEVYNLFTVDPTEIDVLAQKYDTYDMSIITCVPPGTKWKRLIVKARLKEN
jgi:LPXTG-site transpeptidase (sortase) family protein